MKLQMPAFLSWLFRTPQTNYVAILESVAARLAPISATTGGSDYLQKNEPFIHSAFDAIASKSPLTAIKLLMRIEKARCPKKDNTFWESFLPKIEDSLKNCPPEDKAPAYRAILTYAHTGLLKEFVVNHADEIGPLLSNNDRYDYVEHIFKHIDPRDTSLLANALDKYATHFEQHLKLPNQHRATSICNDISTLCRAYKACHRDIPAYIEEARTLAIQQLVCKAFNEVALSEPSLCRVAGTLHDLLRLGIRAEDPVIRRKSTAGKENIILFRLERPIGGFSSEDTPPSLLYILCKTKDHRLETGELKPLLSSHDVDDLAKAFGATFASNKTKAEVNRMATELRASNEVHYPTPTLVRAA